MELQTTEAERLAGPLWFERWRALRRWRDHALLTIAVGLTVLLLQWSRLNALWRVVFVILMGAAVIYGVLAPPRMRALVPSADAPWLQGWKRHRRHLRLYRLLAVAALALGTWAVVVRVNDPHGRLGVSALVAAGVLTLFVTTVLLYCAVEAGEQAQKLVPAARDADVLERWRREDEAAERAEAAALKAQQREDERERRREWRRQRSCLQQARAQALLRGPLFRRDLVVPIRGAYVPLEELERNVWSGRWRILQVEPDHRTIYHPAEYGPHGNPLLRAAGHTECKGRAWHERIPLQWSVFIEELMVEPR